MAYYHGQQGSVSFNKDNGQAVSAIAAVRSWTLTVTKDQLETTKHGDRSRSFVGGLISAEGTCEILYTASSDAQTKNLINAAGEQDDTGKNRFELFVASGKKIVFDAMITSADYGAIGGELTVVTVNFVSTGNITLSGLDGT